MERKNQTILNILRSALMGRKLTKLGMWENQDEMLDVRIAPDEMAGPPVVRVLLKGAHEERWDTFPPDAEFNYEDNGTSNAGVPERVWVVRHMRSGEFAEPRTLCKELPTSQLVNKVFTDRIFGIFTDEEEAKKASKKIYLEAKVKRAMDEANDLFGNITSRVNAKELLTMVERAFGIESNHAKNLKHAIGQLDRLEEELQKGS